MPAGKDASEAPTAAAARVCRFAPSIVLLPVLRYKVIFTCDFLDLACQAGCNAQG